jgi:tetratricopeptide (TPR) repeat protein
MCETHFATGRQRLLDRDTLRACKHKSPAVILSAKSPRTQMRHPLSYFLLLIFCAILNACGSAEERTNRYISRAQTLFEAGDYSNARLEGRNAAQIDPKNAEVRYLLALIAEQDQQFRLMLGNLRLTVDLDPQHIDARVKLGNLYYLAKAFGRAANEADAAMQIAPQDANVRALHAKVLAEQGYIAAALDEIDVALSIDPDNLDVAMVKTGLYLANDQRELALRFLNDAIGRFDRESSRRLRQLKVIILAEDHQTDALEAEFRALVDDFPDDDGFSFGLARLYTVQGRKSDAEAVLRRLIALEPDNVDARLSLASTLGELENPEVAESVLQEFVAESPDNVQLKMTLAQLYESHGKLEEALSTYGAAAGLDPVSPAGFYARARRVALLIDKREFARAYEENEEILRDAPANFDALAYRAGLNMVEEKYDEAIVDMRLAVRNDQNSTRALYLLGTAYRLRGDPVLAADTYRQLLKIKPDHPYGIRELAKILVAQNNPDEAAALLRQRLSDDENDAEARSGLIDALLAKPDFDAAEAEARRLAALETRNGLGDYQLGRVLLAQGRFDEAEAAYRRVLDKKPGLPQGIQNLAETMVADGRPDEAVDYVNSYLAQNPANSRIRLILADLLVRQGATDMAMQLYQKILTDDPMLVEAYLGLGRLQKDDPQARIDLFERGLRLNPGQPQLTGILGQAYEHAGRIDDAISVYEALIEGNPNSPAAINNLAALLLDYRTDEDSFQRALRLVSDFESSPNPAYLDTLGWAYYRLGEHEQAIFFLERAATGARRVPVLRYHLGMAYLAANNRYAARRELHEAITLSKTEFTGYDEAQNVLAKLQESNRQK